MSACEKVDMLQYFGAAQHAVFVVVGFCQQMLDLMVSRDGVVGQHPHSHFVGVEDAVTVLVEVLECLQLLAGFGMICLSSWNRLFGRVKTLINRR